MSKNANRMGWRRLSVCVLVFAIGLFFNACGASQNAGPLPDSPLTDKGNPKLDSQLNQLVAAEESGEAEQFASRSGITLTDGKVRVIIECLPGRLDEAANAAEAAGATIEATHGDLLQVLVPVNVLPDLAGAESIRLIRLPMEALPDAGSNTYGAVDVFIVQVAVL